MASTENDIKPIVDDIDNFDSELAARQLCREHGVKIYLGGYFNYPFGWRLLVESAIKRIENRDIYLASVREVNGMMEIDFTARDRDDEILMWRLANTMQRKSRVTCMFCAAGAETTVHKDKILVCCPACEDGLENGVSKQGARTHTWLDDF